MKTVYLAKDPKPSKNGLPPYGFVWRFRGVPMFHDSVGWHGAEIIESYTDAEFDDLGLHGELSHGQRAILCQACDTLKVIDEDQDTRDELRCDNCEIVLRKDAHNKGTK